MDRTVQELAAEVKGFVDEKYRELDGRILEVEQKSVRRGSADGLMPTESLGRAFTEDPRLHEFAQNRKSGIGGRLTIETKAITSVANSAASLIAQPARDQPALIPQTSLSVRDLVTVIPITTGSVEVPFQTGRTNNAGMVAEGTLKPESSLTFDMRQVPVRKIAHWMLASMEALDDAPQLRGIIDSELVYGVAYLEDLQLLKGDGTGQNLTGMNPLATPYVEPTGLELVNPNRIDMIGAALLQSALADFPADGIILHPADWMRIRFIKDGDGKYLLGDPGSAAPPILFGKPVVESKAQTVGEFTVGQFKAAATLYDRMSTTVMISTEDGDNFRKNLCTLLAEERVAFAVRQPKALTHGAFGD